MKQIKIKEVRYMNLERKRKYIVHANNRIYKGMFLTQPHYTFPYIILTFVTTINDGVKYKLPDAIFDKTDTFYDAQEYLNEIKELANSARQSMEQRALNKILKGLINETFEWF
jgi:hypothetical protein